MALRWYAKYYKYTGNSLYQYTKSNTCWVPMTHLMTCRYTNAAYIKYDGKCFYFIYSGYDLRNYSPVRWNRDLHSNGVPNSTSVSTRQSQNVNEPSMMERPGQARPCVTCGGDIMRNNTVSVTASTGHQHASFHPFGYVELMQTKMAMPYTPLIHNADGENGNQYESHSASNTARLLWERWTPSKLLRWWSSWLPSWWLPSDGPPGDRRNGSHRGPFLEEFLIMVVHLLMVAHLVFMVHPERVVHLIIEIILMRGVVEALWIEKTIDPHDIWDFADHKACRDHKDLKEWEFLLDNWQQIII